MLNRRRISVAMSSIGTSGLRPVRFDTVAKLILLRSLSSSVSQAVRRLAAKVSRFGPAARSRSLSTTEVAPCCRACCIIVLVIRSRISPRSRFPPELSPLLPPQSRSSSLSVRHTLTLSGIRWAGPCGLGASRRGPGSPILVIASLLSPPSTPL